MEESRGWLYNFNKAMRGVIAFMVVSLCFAILFFLCVKQIPIDNKELIYLAAGIILGTLKDVTGYYFGSSKDKSDMDKVTNAVNLNESK